VNTVTCDISEGWRQLHSSKDYFHFAKGKVLSVIKALSWAGWDMEPCTQNCLLVTDNSFNEAAYYCVQAYFTLLCTWVYWLLFLVFFLLTWPKTLTHSLTYTHTHIPVKASHNLDSQRLLQWVCVCVWGGGGCAHTCGYAYIHVCTMLSTNIHHVSEVPMFALYPRRKKVQLAERLWRESCTTLIPHCRFQWW
jgi:hypothetical protein